MSDVFVTGFEPPANCNRGRRHNHWADFVKAHMAVGQYVEEEMNGLVDGSDPRRIHMANCKTCQAVARTVIACSFSQGDGHPDILKLVDDISSAKITEDDPRLAHLNECPTCQGLIRSLGPIACAIAWFEAYCQ